MIDQHRPQTIPDLMLEPLVRAALAEDLGEYGDVTSRAVIPEGARYEARLPQDSLAHI